MSWFAIAAGDGLKFGSTTELPDRTVWRLRWMSRARSPCQLYSQDLNMSDLGLRLTRICLVHAREVDDNQPCEDGPVVLVGEAWLQASQKQYASRHLR
jgi:hypothetical protein